MGFAHTLTPVAAVTATILSFPFSATAQAQRPGAVGQEARQDIASWLQSGDRHLEAWGAWYAGNGQLRHLAPLVQNVVRERLRSQRAVDATLDIALDALIQLQSPLDQDVLRDVYAVRPEQALIVASFTKDAGDVLNEVVQSAKGHKWFAAANLLLVRQSPALASHALSGLRLKLTILLVDHGHSMGIASGMGGGTGCGLSGTAPGMPPWATYMLTSIPAGGDAVLAMGPKAMYYRRSVAPAGQTPAFSSMEFGGPTEDDRIAYAAAAAGMTSSEIPLRGAEQHSISLQQDSDLRATLLRIRSDLTRRYDLFLRMLVGRQVLPEDAAARYPAQIDLEVQDRRTPVK